jgi:uncharacterized protein (TIGR03083 family)
MGYPEMKTAIDLLSGLQEQASALSNEELEAPSRCTGWRVAELLGHMEAQALSLVSESAEEITGAPPEIDRYDLYYRGMPHTPNDVVREHYITYAAGKRLPLIRQSFIYCLDGIIRDLPKVPGDRVTQRYTHPGNTPLLRSKHRELVASRHFEFICHGMDIAHAVGRPEVVTPEAAAVVIDQLDRMFGQSMPEALGWDDKHYILCATGRVPLTPNELEILGPLADIFPACTLWGGTRSTLVGIRAGNPL